MIISDKEEVVAILKFLEVSPDNSKSQIHVVEDKLSPRRPVSGFVEQKAFIAIAPVMSSSAIEKDVSQQDTIRGS